MSSTSGVVVEGWRQKEAQHFATVLILFDSGVRTKSEQNKVGSTNFDYVSVRLGTYFVARCVFLPYFGHSIRVRVYGSKNFCVQPDP
jgi:hypothetical protein